MIDEKEVITAAVTLKKYCDNTHFIYGCSKCPLEHLCESINYHVRDKLSEFMTDIIQEVKHLDEC